MSGVEQRRREISIRANQPWWKVDFAELWDYRSLIWLTAYRDVMAQFRQTVLGVVWMFLPSLLTTVVFTVVFGEIAGVSTGGQPKFLFYQSGLLAWSFFSRNLTAQSRVLRADRNIYEKIYFPRLVKPLANCLSKSVQTVWDLGIFLGFFTYFRYFTPEGAMLFWPGLKILVFPLLLILALLMAMGIGLVISSLSVRYRDFGFASSFGIQMGIYATPVIFPLSSVPEKWEWLIKLNPMSLVVEGCRWVFLGGGSIDAQLVIQSLVITAVIFLAGVLMFQVVTKDFIDYA